MLVANTSKRPLPTPHEPTEDEEWRLAELEYRASLKIAQKQGEDGPTAYPLKKTERDELKALRLQAEDARVPMWDGLEFKFGAAGKAGSVLNLPQRVAQHLAETHPSLSIAEKDIPAKVEPESPEVLTRQDRVQAVLEAPDNPMTNAIARATANPVAVE